MALITYAQALRHLKLTDDQGSPSDLSQDVTLKMEQATALVIAHIKRPGHTWTVATDPAADAEFAIVQAVILQVLRHLDRFRGDAETEESAQALRTLLRTNLSMLRDPTLA